MDISVIIVNWNTRTFLLQCLESLYQGAGDTTMEVWVVDNGSGDGSAVAVRERFPQVALIESQTNLGFARASNQAMKLSKGPYMLLLNPDTRVKPGTIGRLVSFMETHPDVGIAGAQLLNADGTKQNSVANFPSLGTELLNKSLLRWLFPKTFPGKERDYPEPVEVDSVVGACMMVRREAVSEVGWLDEDYFLFLEETDWCFRMKRAGWKIYHCPRAEVTHLQGKSAEIEKSKAKLEYHRSRYHFFRKNRGRFQEVILRIGVVMRLWVKWMAMAVLCLLTFFSVRRWREKLSTFSYLLWWHARLCPERMGLRSVPQA